jgi:hypothetical protein
VRALLVCGLAIAAIFAACGPGGAVDENLVPTATPVVAPLIDPATSKPAKTKAPAKTVYYSNCAEARSAGAAPLRRGDAGYRSGLDRDNDGIACE